MASTHRRGFIQGVVGAAATAALTAVGKGKPQPDDAPIRGLRAWEDRRGLALVDRRKSHDKFDSARIQAAIDDAVERGLGGVLFSSRVYELNEPVRIPPVRGFILQGVGGTTFQRTASGATGAAFVIAGGTGDLHEDIRFENLSFYGGMKNLAELGSRRARGRKNGRSASKGQAEVFWNEGTLRSAISVSGDLSSYWDTNGDDAENPHGVVRNITVDNCAFRGIAGLPVYLPRGQGSGTSHQFLPASLPRPRMGLVRIGAVHHQSFRVFGWNSQRCIAFARLPSAIAPGCDPRRFVRRLGRRLQDRKYPRRVSP